MSRALAAARQVALAAGLVALSLGAAWLLLHLALPDAAEAPAPPVLLGTTALLLATAIGVLWASRRRPETPGQ